ncbi:Similar to S.cerevisiae protein DTD1 (D-Tyr-tRNA(Tyr) deacylase) [Malassezia sympodialis ATCC 42132]|uniref:D-aminoacyl-tRNA deacylase n=1 Tax=Malassezia sympodialis (strain ATCC 42132) TaxID=1230383 RepID=A0A1M8A254_MALS4|nr:Similar to S.cerevisiae protein DTD1 (D-Tyr-tRNA(Tyr) deacylase) [Malassezia sympodialis ATCC 42132]
MRAVLQRVKQASVHVDGKLVSSIGPGILALVGITHEDAPEQVDTIVKRILTTKLWPEGATIGGDCVIAPQESRSWRTSVTELGAEILCVSQFTLYAKMKGTKPDFHLAMGGDKAQSCYNDFLAKLRDVYVADKIKDGQFGAMMDVSLVNDGPVTIIIDTSEKK